MIGVLLLLLLVITEMPDTRHDVVLERLPSAIAVLAHLCLETSGG